MELARPGDTVSYKSHTAPLGKPTKIMFPSASSAHPAAAMDPVGGDKVAVGLHGQSVPGNADPAVAVDGGDTQENHYSKTSQALKMEVINHGTEIAEGTDLLVKLNEELKAKMVASQDDIVGILETTVGIKKMILMQLERLRNAMELSYALFVEGNNIHKASTEDSDSMLVDELVAEKSDVDMKVDDVMSKQLEKEVEKLDAEIHGKIEELNGLLGLGDDSFSKELGSLAVVRSVETCTELQEARRELIRVFNEMPIVTRRGIGIKHIGELNSRPFIVACQRKYGADESDARAAALVSAWQDEVKNPSWHPFKIVEVEGTMKAVVDDEDPKLTGLCAEYGDDVCNAVKVAVAEINEHNPSGGFVVAELWNFGEGRIATVNEALKEVCKRLLTLRKRSLQN